MPKYVLTYHGEMSMEDMPTDPEAVQAVMAEWGAWYESMGDGLVDGGAPLSVSTAIDANGATDAPCTVDRLHHHQRRRHGRCNCDGARAAR